jgi:hypothetical protein
VGALRDRDLVPLPRVDELQDRLLQAATGPGQARLARLRRTPELRDMAYSR